MLLLILFAFLAGVVTILSPCILPILPIILSGSVGSSKRRPLGIVTGYVLSFTFFTLFLSSLVRAFGVSADALRLFSIVVIIGFGVMMLVPQAQLWLEKFFSYFTRFSPRTTKQDFLSGMLVGASLGLLWTPCVGPILASVISLALTGSVNGLAVFITLAYSIGTAIPMLAMIYGGQRVLGAIPWLAQRTSQIQKVFGVIMILTGLAIALSLDRKFQVFVLNTFPQYGIGLTQIEDNALIRGQLQNLKKVANVIQTAQRAPELSGGGQWLNSTPLTLEKELQGKVVLLDFWTYSCINCIRTLPYLKGWHDKYKDKGLVIVGVHSPEFEFEKSTKNVEKAVKDFGIAYPVVQDNEFTIWRAYNNQYWPAKYLIDKDGKVRYSHFGEGRYAETEEKIRELLGEPPMDEATTAEMQDVQTVKANQTHEIYLGWERAGSYLRELDVEVDSTKTYSYTSLLPEDSVGLKGDWSVQSEFTRAEKTGAELSIDAQASKVFLVMNTADGKPHTVKVLLDGKELPLANRTIDTNARGEITVDEARKYDLIDLKGKFERHVITIVFDQGVEAYAFTFGS